jgi:hypothetical protein
LFKVDYSKYKSEEDFKLTPVQQILFYKLDKVKNEYAANLRQRQEKAAKKLPPLFGIDITNVSSSFKLLYLVVVFTLMAAGILYGLTKVQKKKKIDRKPKKN